MKIGFTRQIDIPFFCLQDCIGSVLTRSGIQFKKYGLPSYGIYRAQAWLYPRLKAATPINPSKLPQSKLGIKSKCC